MVEAITAQSRDGGGTQITVGLPRHAKADAEPVGRAAAPGPPSAN